MRDEILNPEWRILFPRTKAFQFRYKVIVRLFAMELPYRVTLTERRFSTIERIHFVAKNSMTTSENLWIQLCDEKRFRILWQEFNKFIEIPGLHDYHKNQ